MTDASNAIMPTIDHPTDRPNFTEVGLGDLTIWFSYRTPIAYMYPGEGRVVRENQWGNTTGRHMAYVDDSGPDHRIPGWRFQERLAETLAKATT